MRTVPCHAGQRPRRGDRHLVADRLLVQAARLLLVAEGALPPTPRQRAEPPEVLRLTAAELAGLATRLEGGALPSPPAALTGRASARPGAWPPHDGRLGRVPTGGEAWRPSPSPASAG
jgi:hypothetical protein